MTLWAWVHLLAAASGLIVAALALARGGTTPLAGPLALLSVNQFAWSAAAFGSELTHDSHYRWLGAIAAPLFTPVTFHFVLRFLGRRRTLNSALVFAYALNGAQALLALADFLLVGFEVPGGLLTYAVMMIVTSTPFAIGGVILVGQHLRGAATQLERWRTRVLLAAIFTVSVFTFTDLLADLELPVPRLATLGSIAFSVMLTQLTLGLGLFARVPDRTAALGQAIVLGLFFAVAYLAIFVAYRENLGVLVTALTVVWLSILVLSWLFLAESSRTRAELERFALLGRFSAQMAHDLKNPLAAARGAAEFLVEEMRRRAAHQEREFASILVQQLDRLGAVIERYQRISRLEPAFVEVDLNALVTQVLSLQRFVAGPGVEFKDELCQAVPQLRADPVLLASVLENLVKNALDAMPTGGTLTISTRVADAGAGQIAWLSVHDTGEGMDARAREQAFEPFFTTKASGSGLGLAFVKEVVRAHAGGVSCKSREGMGTVIEVALPLMTCRGVRG